MFTFLTGLDRDVVAIVHEGSYIDVTHLLELYQLSKDDNILWMTLGC